MIGSKKLSTIRQELRAAMVAEGANPIVSLDRRIRELKKNSKSPAKESRTLVLLRDALADLAKEKPRKRPRPARTKRANRVSA
jgi:hypothetical protein